MSCARVRVHDHADGNVAPLEFLPENVHLRLLLGNTPLYSKGSIANGVEIGFINLPICPCRCPPRRTRWLQNRVTSGDSTHGESSKRSPRLDEVVWQQESVLGDEIAAVVDQDLFEKLPQVLGPATAPESLMSWKKAASSWTPWTPMKTMTSSNCQSPRRIPSARHWGS